jgi:hypothetical protein
MDRQQMTTPNLSTADWPAVVQHLRQELALEQERRNPMHDLMLRDWNSRS